MKRDAFLAELAKPRTLNAEEAEQLKRLTSVAFRRLGVKDVKTGNRISYKVHTWPRPGTKSGDERLFEPIVNGKPTPGLLRRELLRKRDLKDLHGI